MSSSQQQLDRADMTSPREPSSIQQVERAGQQLGCRRYSLDDRLSRVVSDVISVSTDLTSARCCENVRSQIWYFVENHRMFPSVILITEANCLTVVKRWEISCVLIMLIRHRVLSFLKSLSHFIVILARVHDLCQNTRSRFTTIEELCRILEACCQSSLFVDPVT